MKGKKYWTWPVAKATGIDHSQKLINLAKIEEKKDPLGIQYFVMNAGHLGGIPDSSFDLVTCFMALHDIVNYEAAVAEVTRVMKRDGRFIFSIMHPCFEHMVINGVRMRAEEAYFARAKHAIEWNMKRLTRPFKTVSFHRSLTDYSLVLAKNLLLILRIIEPPPTKEAVQKYPDLSDALVRPLSIIFEI